MAGVADDPFRSARLILSLRKAGIRDERVLEAMEIVDRSQFFESSLKGLAFEDVCLPIPCGQTALRPSDVGRLLQLLDVKTDGQSVLVVGGGSGYIVALLQRLCGDVRVTERHQALVRDMTTRFAATSSDNVEVKQTDGLKGWPGSATSFDRILLTGTIAAVPDSLTAQLAPGGVIVAPIQHGADITAARIGGNADRQDVPLTGPVMPLTPGISVSL